uniref:NADH dehydrogenase subunit 4L n=1 Tax=Bactronophorus thoracites TaxID=2663719 RepID=UPI0020290F91|nr:NADH dehydrogenase subunit 4L [Bactronophorus thoracites]UPX89041.1 NADH dehydrogenase subunit 4L [Bactronophorus thoracites]UPX89053.1 NADH dehydrogenase subunit 4L [Bactronophorus thoracites]
MFLVWSVFVIFLRHDDFLVILIVLEVGVVSLFTGMMLYLCWVGNVYASYAMIAFLTMFVCESVVGLSLLISSSRNLEHLSTSSFCCLRQ